MGVAFELEPALRRSDCDAPLTPLWRIASGIDREAAGVLSRKVLGRVVGHQGAATGEALPFAARAALTTSPDLGLMSCFDPASRWRWREGAPGGKDNHLLIRPADGRVVVEQGAARMVARAREAILIAPGGETRFVLDQVSRVDLVNLEAARLHGREHGRVTEPMRLIPRGNRGLQVLAHYGAMLLRGFLPLDSAALRGLAIAHVHDLVGLMLDDRDVPRAATPADPRADRIAGIKAEIETRLERRDLGLDMIARLHGVSPRAIQKLFEAETQTFSEYVLERRLERAWHRLVSTRTSGLTISAIAYEVGFGDLSYFNRCFRKRFGRSPSQAKSARSQIDPDDDR